MQLRTIRAKIFISSLSISVILLTLTAIISYSLSIGKIETQQQEQLYHVQKQVEEHLETVFNQVEKIAILFQKNNDLLRYIQMPAADTSDQLIRKDGIESILSNSLRYDPDIESVILSLESGEVFASLVESIGLTQYEINALNYYHFKSLLQLSSVNSEGWKVLTDQPKDVLGLNQFMFSRSLQNRFIYILPLSSNSTMMIVLNPNQLTESFHSASSSVFRYSIAPSSGLNNIDVPYKLDIEVNDPNFEAIKSRYRVMLIMIAIVLLLCSALLTAWFSRRLMLPFAQMERKVAELNAVEHAEDIIYLRSNKSLPGRFRLRLFVFLIINCVIGVLLMVFVHYSYSYQLLKINLDTYYKEFVTQSEGMIEKNINYIESGVNFIIRDAKFQKKLSDDQDHEALAKEIKKLFSYQHVISKNINYLNIYDKQGELMFSTINNLINEQNIQKHNIYNLLEKTQGETVFINENKDEFGDHVILVAKKIYSTKDNRELLGYHLYSINERQLDALSRNLGIPSLEMVIQDPTGAVIYRKENQTGGAGHLVLGETMHKLNWRITSTFDQSELFSGMKEIVLVNGYLLLVVILVILLVIYMLAKRLAQPIEKLIGQIRRVVAVDFKENPISRFHAADEIGELSAHIGAMIDRIKVLMNNIYSFEVTNREIQLAYKKAELSNLLHQMNPHFLYNTLETVRWMAMKLTRGENDVSRIIGELSIYLRSGNYSDNKMVKVKEELIHVKSYLYIQQIRYGDRLSVKWAIDAEAENEWMIRFVLQPLVENALIHGIDQCDRKGNLYIGAARDGTSIRLLVADNGCGLSEERLESIRASWKEHRSDDHIGLSNIAKRLSLYHGDKGKLTLTSKQGYWTKVEIEMPVDHAEDVGRKDEG